LLELYIYKYLTLMLENMNITFGLN